MLVKDIGVKHNAKTTKQRSDGFKQFVSFLLTMSSEYANNKLHNTLLLLDEPETHLHPQAQIDILNELIKISKKNNNIVFFATHSNYLIDKENLERNFQVIKRGNQHTHIDQLTLGKSTFAEVNYKVFGIHTVEYHNQLYGFLEANKKDQLASLKKSKEWKKNDRKGDEIVEMVSFPKYIRNSIHHPENQLNKSFTDKQLKDSIDLLRKMKY